MVYRHIVLSIMVDTLICISFIVYYNIDISKQYKSIGYDLRKSYTYKVSIYNTGTWGGFNLPLPRK